MGASISSAKGKVLAITGQLSNMSTDTQNRSRDSHSLHAAIQSALLKSLLPSLIGPQLLLASPKWNKGKL